MGVALGAGGAAAILAGQDACIRFADENGISALQSLLADGRVARAARDHGVRIALLPPLAEDRIITLPGLTASQAERALTLRAERHFATACDDPVVTATLVDPTEGRFLASLASGDHIARIHAILAAAGIRCRGIHSAFAALFHDDRARHRAVVHAGLLVFGLRMDGRFERLRRVPLKSAALAGALADAGLDEVELQRACEPDATSLAAGAIVRGRVAEFRPPALHADRARRARRRTASMSMAAVLMLGVSICTAAWSLNRDLRSVQRERAALRDDAETALLARAEADALTLSVTRLANASARLAVNDVLASVLSALPPDAELDILEIEGGEVILSGTALAADAVYSGLRISPLVESLEWIGPVRRTTEDGVRREIFGIAAVLRGAGAGG